MKQHMVTAPSDSNRRDRDRGTGSKGMKVSFFASVGLEGSSRYDTADETWLRNAATMAGDDDEDDEDGGDDEDEGGEEA